ncbi:2-polyprenyl-6-methoxyphenol hydroxylase-like FAD-dependent oxidoreductase [Inquilinus ginsengisoli]|uniref:2-polyprenyl-6-methoxyphenol hydroxylase-like FAD-dependent oxidoreductase n=1 Tax=Inquilinus ginsengisoli TaxID=363840 RepID=A0ABU1JJP1_9PROT|nr:flavin-dependent oxidoreductase [Inquilinus ginsengisoli]MDR6288836.1 2-polyprenyl-6-methoxyphenol hydroxylase-like FAD-dependent oxidoreductase [Inquilinus ginsengisoli]
MKAIIVGGGVGGLVTALMLQARGLDCAVFEQASESREIGVGINTLPHAIQELAGLGLLDRLDAIAIRTRELLYCNRFGQVIWREPRGLDAGFAVPQFSIHRGRLHGALHQAARERLGGEIHNGRRLAGFEQDEDGVVAHFVDRHGAPAGSVRGDLLVGADGIHSTVRGALYPGEGPPRWNGMMIWRGARDWPAYMDGRTMIVAGGMQAKAVLYPIAPGETPETRLTNWAVCVRLGDGSTPPPRREDWSRPGQLAEVLPHAARFALPEADISAIVAATPEFWEYPMCDRDPLPRWRHGRVTLLGDAAHPMYPVGSNGASQAILDARALADALAETGDVAAALDRYEQDRRPKTAEIVRLNRVGGPEGVIDAVEQLAPDGFSDIDAVLPHDQRQAIVRGYASVAGFVAKPAAAGS